MQKTGHSYSSGEWLVRPGSEQEFIQRWTTFMGAWESQQAQEAWREMPQMQVMLGHCRALCDEYDTYRYTLAASLGR